MSWLFSQALVEEYLGGGCSDGEQSVPLSVMPTQHKFWRNDRMMEFSKLSQFGLMCAVLTEQDGEELLTLFLEDFHVKTSVQQEKVPELKVPAAQCGSRWHELLARYSQDTHSWKTVQCSLLEDLESSLQIWPQSGSMRNGVCYQQQMSVEFTYDQECGLKLPTTGANEWKGCSRKRHINSPDFRGAKMSEGLRICETDPIYLNPLFAELVMMWPLGWTDLKPLAMDKFLEWQQQHSVYSIKG